MTETPSPQPAAKDQAPSADKASDGKGPAKKRPSRRGSSRRARARKAAAKQDASPRQDAGQGDAGKTEAGKANAGKANAGKAEGPRTKAKSKSKPNGRPKASNRRQRRRRRTSPSKSFWTGGGPARSDGQAPRIRPTTDPSAVPRSLGTPPLSPETAPDQRLAIVYEEAVRAATALAAAGGILDQPIEAEDPDAP